MFEMIEPFQQFLPDSVGGERNLGRPQRIDSGADFSTEIRHDMIAQPRLRLRRVVNGHEEVDAIGRELPVFIVGAFTLAALIVFVLTGNVWWLPGIALAVGNSAGGWIGSHLTISKGEVLVRRVLYAALIVMAMKLLF